MGDRQVDKSFHLTAEHIKLAQQTQVGVDNSMVCNFGGLPYSLPRYVVHMPAVDDAVVITQGDAPSGSAWSDIFAALARAKEDVVRMGGEMDKVFQILLDNAGSRVDPGEYVLVPTRGDVLRWRPAGDRLTWGLGKR